MVKKIAMVLLMCIGSIAFAEELSLEGWWAWGGLQVSVHGNTVTLNGRGGVTGFVSASLNTAMRNKTIELIIENAGNSDFSSGRLMKITVNRDDRLVHPLNVPNLILGEYIPVSVTRIEFTLPADFDGKLGFVFYQADLNGLRITATYR